MTKKNRATRHEKTDPTPAGVPVNFKRPLTLQEQMLRAIRSEDFRRAMQARGFETPEEADDFDIPDDPADPSTPHEMHFEPDLGREITNAERMVLNEQRKVFDAELEKARKAAPPPRQEPKPKQPKGAAKEPPPDDSEED